MLYRGREGTRGFTLIELAIVLGITGLLFTGLWRLLSNGNQQLRDQATASQQQQLITAVSTYLATPHGQLWMAGIGANASSPLALPPSGSPAASAGCPAAVLALNVDLCTILSPGFSAATVNPYGQIYNIQVLKDSTPSGTSPQSYSFMIVTSAGDTIPDTDGGRISSMIGGDGGFIYSNNVCVPAGVADATVSHWACGAYGAWAQNITTLAGAINYGFTVAFATSGTVASRTYYSPTQNSLQPWLARQQMPGDTSFGYNTMAWDLFVGGSAAGAPYNINLIPPTGLLGGALTGASINMGGVSTGSPGGTGAAFEVANITSGGSINVANGQINMAALPSGGGAGNLGTPATINMGGGTINMGNETYDAATTTWGPNAAGGGVINLQGGSILDSASDFAQVAINITAATPLDENNGTTATANPLVSIGTGCSLTSGITGLTQSNFCTPGLQVLGDEYVNGQLTANSLYAQTFIYNSSDMRLKTDIHTLKNSLDAIMKLNPVDFRFKATGQESLGVIAQDVEKVYPQLVKERPDGMKLVNYEGLIAPLIGAVQELKQENNELREQLRVQAIRQDKLEQQLKSKDATSR